MVKTIMDTFVVNWKRNYEFMFTRQSFLNSIKLSNIFGYSKSMFTKNIFIVTYLASPSPVNFHSAGGIIPASKGGKIMMNYA